MTQIFVEVAIDSTSYINVPSLCDGQKIAAAAICDFPLESLKNLFSFQGETYCYDFGSCPFPRRARLVTGLKMPKKNHLGLIRQGVDAWNTWRERAAAQPDLSRADLTKADLREADLRKANLGGANLGEANLVSAYLGGTIFTSADLGLADFSGAFLSGAFLGGADVRGATLVKADLQHAVLDGANFGGANLSQADLSVAKCSRANFSGANLSGAFLGQAYFGQANLSGADFSGAYLGGADLSWANLSGANFSGANLSGAILEGATLIETNLENADLNGCRIYGISAWNIKANQETKQTSLIIAPRGEASITVDDIQVAQFIHLILKYENLRTVLNTVTKRGVLILGRFGGGGLQVLREVAEALRQCGYLPMIFDFERPEGRDYSNTCRTRPFCCGGSQWTFRAARALRNRAALEDSFCAYSRKRKATIRDVRRSPGV